jgi:hypothetical protein
MASNEEIRKALTDAGIDDATADKAVKNINKIREAEEARKDALVELLAEMKNVQNAEQEAAKILQQQIANKTKLSVLEAKLATIRGNEEQSLKNLSDAYDIFSKAQKELSVQRIQGNATAEDEARLQAEIKNAYGMTLDELREAKKRYEELDPVYEKIKKESAEFAEGLATTASTIFPIYSKTATRMFQSINEQIVKARENPKALLDGFKKIFNARNAFLAITAQVATATLQLAMATDTATAAFAAQTGAGRALTATISDVAGANRNLGLSAELTGKAATELFDSFTGFMQLGKDAQDSLVKTVATLGRFGVDGKTAAQTLTLFNKNMGMSIKESVELTKNLAMMGTKIGISSKQMVSGFVQASKTLAVYGKSAVKVFSDLAAQAKAANVETSTLLGLAEKFDTFSSAADAAGKLNSILGTQISATEMLSMKENERIEALIRSIQAQGLAFKDMDRYSQKAIAAAAGINNMAEAQRIFGMSVRDYRKGLREGAEEEEFNQALKDTMTIVEKLKKAGQAFAISFGPAIDTIANFVQAIADFNQQTGAVTMFIAVIGGLVIFSKILAVIAPVLGLMGVAGPAAGGGFTALGAGIAAGAPGITAGILPLLGLAAAMVLLAGAFYIIGGATGEGGGLAVLGVMLSVAAGIIALGLAVAGLGLAAPFILAGAGAMSILALSLGGLALAMKAFETEKLKSLATIIGAFSGENEVKTTFISDITDFTKALVSQEATLKPMLGDLALIATGKTVQDVTTNTAAYNFNSFSANFKNIFKPEITVKIGDKELRGIVQEEIPTSSRFTDE